MKQVSRTKHSFAALGIMLASVIGTLAVLEITARAYERDFRFDSQLARETELLHWTSPAAFDPALGWVPKAGQSSGPEGETIDILPDTTRATGSLLLRDHPAVLAVGDSFTFGDEVSDSASWPAILERIAGVRVINGGVFGYGIDQTALRASRLLDRYSPELLVFALIANDIERTELSKRDGAEKPYFVLARNGVPLLQGVPVPRPETYRSAPLIDELKNAAARSLLVDRFMRRTVPEWWFVGDGNTKVHHNGDAVSCALIRQTGQRAMTTSAAFVVLLQYTKEDVSDATVQARISRLKGCLEPDHVRVVDTADELRAIRACDPARFNALYSRKWGHMTAEGNRITAMMLMPELHTMLKLAAVSDPPTAAKLC